MKIGLWLFLVLSVTCNVHAQYSRYVIRFSNKGGTPYSLDNPSAYLSAKAVTRRTKFNIRTDSTDLPAPSWFFDSIRAAGAVTVRSYSKWLNQVLIITTDTAALSRISRLPFVKAAAPIALRPLVARTPVDKFQIELSDIPLQPANINTPQDDAQYYGSSYGQIHIHQGEFLHHSGFTGKGITIAVLDAGFRNYTVLTAFDSLRKNHQILGEWDFVANESSVTEDHPHGMWCFSMMSANQPGKYVGTAPGASYYLFRTEDAATEYPVEEHNWVVAAERADSLGADMISSSLGYSEFDDPTFNHVYADMNGNTTMITIGADLAMKKGMIVCNSAGNSGTSAWKYIIAPADGDSVLAIGAVDINGIPASFSSYGPSADGRIKPNVASVGRNAYFIQTNDLVAVGNGTSLANPNLAGLIACLWGAFPEFSNMDILDAVQRSASQYNAPDNRVGYGIPNMQSAFNLLLKKKQDLILKDDWIRPFPNPFSDNLVILVKAPQTGTLELQLTDILGHILKTDKISVQQDQVYTLNYPDLGRYPSGVYHLRVSDGKNKKTVRLVK